jgi:hypothetical protein
MSKRKKRREGERGRDDNAGDALDGDGPDLTRDGANSPDTDDIAAVVGRKLLRTSTKWTL